MSKKAKKRESYFKLYTQNWQKILPHMKGIPEIHEAVFVCPICFTMFTKDELERNPVVLSLEHVPPKSLGGKERTLTCARCNTTSGHMLDNSLEQEFIFRHHMSGNLQAGLKASLVADDKITSNGKFRITDDKIDFGYLEDQSNPSELQQMNKMFANNEIQRLTIQIKGNFDVKVIDIALARVALLELFIRYGYVLVALKNMRKIRDWIQAPHDRQSNEKVPYTNNLHPDTLEGLHIITEPKWLRSFFVVFSLKVNNFEEKHGVFFPLPDDEELEIYNQVRIRSKQGKLSLESRSLTLEASDIVKDPFYPIRMLNDIKKARNE